MSEVQRDAVVRRIQALLQKTVENGCTEEEAIAAAAKAGELMDAYRLEQSDVEITAEPISDVFMSRILRQRVSPADYCQRGICRYCGVRMWFEFRDGARVVRCLGLKPDVEMAQYLYDMITKAISHQVNKIYYPTVTGTGSPGLVRQLCWDFQRGMAARIGERLEAMAAANEPVAKTANGTALVVVKGAVVDAAWAKLGITLGKTRGTAVRNAEAYHEGRAAGDRVNLERPVGETRRQRLA